MVVGACAASPAAMWALDCHVQIVQELADIDRAVAAWTVAQD
jgi:hypothetical protein